MQNICFSDNMAMIEGTTLHLPKLRNEIRSILRCGVRACPIRANEPPMLSLRATLLEQVNAKKQELFHANLPRLVQEAHAEEDDSGHKVRLEIDRNLFNFGGVYFIVLDDVLLEAGPWRLELFAARQ